MSEQFDSTGLSAEEAKVKGKLDGGKAPVLQGVIQYFPRAVQAVARLSAFGAKKYSWGGWANVDGGITRYGNALARHQIEEAKGIPIDDETGELHATAQAWNALARLELILRQTEDIQREIDEGVETAAAVPEGGWEHASAAYDMVDHEHNNGFSCPLVEPITLQERIDRAFDVVGTDPEFLTDDNEERCTFCHAREGEDHSFGCPNRVDFSQLQHLRSLARTITTAEPAPALVFEGGYVASEEAPVEFHRLGQSERIRRLHDAEDALTGGKGFAHYGLWYNAEIER